MSSTLNKTHVYQGFYFDNKIKSHFYTGNSFLRYQEGMGPDELVELAFEILGEEEFMPELKQIIEELLGEGNYVYDYWEFGPDYFSLYWWISKEVYHEKLQLIRQWVAYEEINELIEINEKV